MLLLSNNSMSRVITTISIVLALCACGGGGSSPATTPMIPPPQPSLEITALRVFSALSFDSPVLMLQAPGDSSRWFVLEQRGLVRVFDNESAVSTSSVFVDISDRVNSAASEAGLLGMAFHPDFASNGQVFLSYTASGSPLESVVSRLQSTDGGLTLAADSEAIVMTLLQPQSNHNGGNIAFGPDGFLYAGWGDGGGAGDPQNNAQNTTNLFGSITRVDVDAAAPYAIPATNPFATNSECLQGFGNADCPELFAWGFRNPWRWSFDRQTGALWLGDVGQFDWEEIDRVEIGGNYGWREREGANCFDPPIGCSTDFLDPITEYDHSLGASVTGGYVYRGNVISALRGLYVYGDFSSGRIWSVAADSAQSVSGTELLDTTLNIASFAQDNDGELYIVDYGGELYQIVDASQ